MSRSAMTSLADGVYTYIADDGTHTTTVVYLGGLGLLAFNDVPVERSTVQLYAPTVLRYLERRVAFGDVQHYGFPDAHHQQQQGVAL